MRKTFVKPPVQCLAYDVSLIKVRSPFSPLIRYRITKRLDKMWETRRQIRSNEEMANSLEEGDEKRGHRELVRRKIRVWRTWVDDERREV